MISQYYYVNTIIGCGQLKLNYEKQLVISLKKRIGILKWARRQHHGNGFVTTCYSDSSNASIKLILIRFMSSVSAKSVEVSVVIVHLNFY